MGLKVRPFESIYFARLIEDTYPSTPKKTEQINIRNIFLLLKKSNRRKHSRNVMAMSIIDIFPPESNTAIAISIANFNSLLTIKMSQPNATTVVISSLK